MCCQLSARVAGKGAACSHCAALMFCLESFKSQGLSTIPNDCTVTDTLQKWHVPPKRSIQPQPVRSISFMKSEYGKKTAYKSTQKEKFDPRHVDDHTLSGTGVSALMTDVLASCPTSGIQQFWPITKTGAEVAIDEYEDEMLPKSLALASSESECNFGSLESLIVYQASNPSILPDTVTELADIDPECAVFQELCHLYESQQVISVELSMHIQQKTVMQSKSPLWQDLRNGRITSSRFGQIIHRRETTDAASIVTQIMGYKTPQSSSLPQLQWGLEKEPEAIKSYVNYMQGKVIVIPSGLTLIPEHSYLGATADGLIEHSERPGNPGVLEIKCPYSVKGVTVHKMSPLAIVSNYPNFHITDSEDHHLYKEHNYYYQVQGEMAIKGCNWAHFVTWTEAGLHVEKIKFDKELWKAFIFPKLQEFYINILVPEILLRKVQCNVN